MSGLAQTPAAAAGARGRREIRVPGTPAVGSVRQVSGTCVRPFTAGDVLAAGVLLAQRHARHRLDRPLLSARYEDPAAATAEVAVAFGTAGVSGAFAVRGGKPAGYLLGFPKPGGLWGPSVWVESAGHAATDGETLRDLYAVAAAGWVASGLSAHYVLVPATEEELVRAWFRLGFGQQHCHGLARGRTAAPPELGTDVLSRSHPVSPAGRR